MDKALLEKAAQCKSAEELKAFAAEAGRDISEEEAKELFDKVNGAAPLTDEELETVAGGCGGSSSSSSGSGNVRDYNAEPDIDVL